MTKPQMQEAIYDPRYHFEDHRLNELIASLGKLPEFQGEWAVVKNNLTQKLPEPLEQALVGSLASPLT